MGRIRICATKAQENEEMDSRFENEEEEQKYYANLPTAETKYGKHTYKFTGTFFPSYTSASEDAKERRQVFGENARVKKLEGGYHERYGKSDAWIVVIKD
jgi:hypothetical protein